MGLFVCSYSKTIKYAHFSERPDCFVQHSMLTNAAS